MVVLVLSRCYCCVFILHFPEIACVQSCNDFSLDFWLNDNFMKVFGLSFLFFRGLFFVVQKFWFIWAHQIFFFFSEVASASVCHQQCFWPFTLNKILKYSGMCLQLRAISSKQKRIKNVSAVRLPREVSLPLIKLFLGVFTNVSESFVCYQWNKKWGSNYHNDKIMTVVR